MVSYLLSGACSAPSVRLSPTFTPAKGLPAASVTVPRMWQESNSSAQTSVECRATQSVSRQIATPTVGRLKVETGPAIVRFCTLLSPLLHRGRARSRAQTSELAHRSVPHGYDFGP